MKIKYEQKNEPIWISHQRALGKTPHIHKEIELVFVEKGSAFAHADGFKATIKTGDVFIAFPNQIHYYEKSDEGKYHVLCLNHRLFYGLKETFFSSAPTTNIVTFTPEIKRLLNKALHSDPQDSLRISGYLNVIMSEILPHLEITEGTRRDNGTLREVLDWCENHYMDDISLATVAEGTHLSSCYISHLFSNKLGLGFSDYINILRITAACELLTHTDKKISDISGNVGYSTIRSFNRAFSKIMETTPFEYRTKSV